MLAAGTVEDIHNMNLASINYSFFHSPLRTDNNVAGLTDCYTKKTHQNKIRSVKGKDGRTRWSRGLSHKSADA